MKFTAKKLSALLLAASLSLSLAACGGNNTPAKPSASTAASSTPAQEADTAAYILYKQPC